MRSLTDEAKEIVRVYMADGKVATRREISDQVEKCISRPDEYRVNILNGVIKVLTESHEMDVVERGKYKLGKGLPVLTKEQILERHLENCVDNLKAVCNINVAESTKEEEMLVIEIANITNKIKGLLSEFKGGAWRKDKQAEEKPVAEKPTVDKYVEENHVDEPAEKLAVTGKKVTASVNKSTHSVSKNDKSK